MRGTGPQPGAGAEPRLSCTLLPFLSCAFRSRHRDSCGPRARRWSSGPGASLGPGGFPPRFAGESGGLPFGVGGAPPLPRVGRWDTTPTGWVSKNKVR